MRKIFLWTIALCFSTVLSAQTTDEEITMISSVPFRSVEMIPDSAVHVMVAYTELEPQLLADIDWLNYTPMNDRKELRNEKNRFVVMWMSGSPTVSIKFDERVMDFTGVEPAVLIAYMMGWTKYSLEHDYSDNLVKCTTAGLTNAANFYKRNKKFLKKNKGLESLLTMVENNEVENYVKTAVEG